MRPALRDPVMHCSRSIDLMHARARRHDRRDALRASARNAPAIK